MADIAYFNGYSYIILNTIIDFQEIPIYILVKGGIVGYSEFVYEVYMFSILRQSLSLYHRGLFVINCYFRYKEYKY